MNRISTIKGLLCLIFLYACILDAKANIKLEGETFPACESTTKLFDLKQYCGDNNCNKTAIEMLTSNEDEYNFLDNNKTYVVYSSEGKLYETKCHESSNLILQEFDMLSKICLRYIKLVYIPIDDDDNKENDFYKPGSMNEHGIIRPDNKEKKCDGQKQYFHSKNYLYSFLKVDNNVSLSYVTLSSTNKTNLNEREESRLNGTFYDIKMNLDTIKESDWYQFFMGGLNILLVLLSIFFEILKQRISRLITKIRVKKNLSLIHI